VVSAAQIRYLNVVESSDERATARLIAERTLALAGVDLSAQPPRPRRLVLLLSASLSVVLAAGLALWWSQGRDAAARPDRHGGQGLSAAAPGDGDRDVGYLNCNAWPSASVFVDGRRLPGTTPLRNVRLPVGPHTLTLVSADGTLRKEVQVNILPAQTRTLAVALDR
jgi:hypothetical protein